MFTRRKQNAAVPEVGAEAPEFNLPSAQGGQLRLSMRTVRGPVVVAFYRPGNEEDVEYFKALALKEQEINLAAASVAGIGVAEPSAARDFARASGLKSYLLYDYARATSAQWGLLEGDRRHGHSSRPAVFIVGPDGKVAHAWTAERPAPDELLEKVSAITGLPKKPEEKPAEAEGEADGDKPKKMSAEERERIKAERRAAREAGKTVKTEGTSPAAPGTAAGGDQPKKMSKEERERIKAERRAARESGKSLKSDAPGVPAAGAETAEAPADPPAEAPKKMSAEERERIKAERRSAREAGKSVETGASETTTPDGADAGEKADNAPAGPPKMSKEERERIKAERRAARESGQSLKKPAEEQSSDDEDAGASAGATEPEARQ